MRNPDEFDAFYKDARSRLLLLTYALTGDLAASRSAVRDCFVVAWHHWRKISRLEDPEAWARPRAFAHAQRRHTARLWHRDKGLDPEAKASLDALGKLTVTQRKALLLTQLTTLPMNGMARELGLTSTEAERELQNATAQFALHRDVATTSIRSMFEPLRVHVEETRWPRPSILRRAGAARRRTHTAVGAAAAVVILVASGSLVTDTAGVHPSLLSLFRDRGTHTAAETSGTPTSEPPEQALPTDAMLTAQQIGSFVRAPHWTVGSTNANTAGDGLVLPCQQHRYADRKGIAAVFRTFDTGPGKRAPKVSADEAVEVSQTPARARRAYARALDWYAGCTDERTQLLSTRRVGNVGDEATLLVLRSWGRPVTTMTVGVARTGQLTATTMSRVPGTSHPDFGASARMLAAAVTGVCRLPDAGPCSGRPQLAVVPPLPVGQVPSMLAEVDLPPVSGVALPWVGTEPRRAMDNVAATSCDHTDFSAASFSNNVTRSFLIPEAKRLPAQFGLTETVGSLPHRQAQALVAEVRKKLAACPDKSLGTKVQRVAQIATPRRDLSVWHVTTEISDKSSVDFFMGIVRDGTSVAQVGFVPFGHTTMGPGAFNALAERALDRLPALPPPRSGG